MIFTVLPLDPWTKGGLYFFAVCVLVVSEYTLVYRPLQNLAEVRKKQLEFHFKPFIESAELDGVPAKLRANVMLVKFSVTGRRFYQFYSCGMEGDPDANLNFSIKKGFCGEIFKKQAHKVHYRDLRNDPHPKNFGFSAKETDQTTHVLAVATIPLYTEVKRWRGDVHFHYFGALNVDATDNAGADLLAQPEIQKAIKAFAKFVQITLG